MLLEIDGYAEKLPSLSSSMLGVHLTMMEVQLEEHRKWCKWLTRPPGVQADSGSPAGGASQSSGECTTAPDAAAEPPNPTL
jgi:hypothetical protein